MITIQIGEIKVGNIIKLVNKNEIRLTIARPRWSDVTQRTISQHLKRSCSYYRSLPFVQSAKHQIGLRKFIVSILDSSQWSNRQFIKYSYVANVSDPCCKAFGLDSPQPLNILIRVTLGMNQISRVFLKSHIHSSSSFLSYIRVCINYRHNEHCGA